MFDVKQNTNINITANIIDTMLDKQISVLETRKNVNRHILLLMLLEFAVLTISLNI